ncbi:hypothetical protein [Candidatus Pseudomonas adelgestsugas]|uniref:Uncharacterized protein n=2 Tax=Candidatus Pseudomonas adelgestsugas TaxID=1302376 RepID=A0ABX5R937_9PSED|nr:hypothetical protein C3B55_00834 [Candidatus Pseudomonas adelgestsugas]
MISANTGVLMSDLALADEPLTVFVSDSAYIYDGSIVRHRANTYLSLLPLTLYSYENKDAHE